MQGLGQNYDLPESEVLGSIEVNPWNKNEGGIRVLDDPNFVEVIDMEDTPDDDEEVIYS